VYHFAKTTDLSAFKKGENVTISAHAYKKMEVGVSIVAAAAPAKPAPVKPAKPAPKTMTTTKTTTKTTK
jgi:multidrug resistance efflux pump